jgi:hypothetical protein
MPSGTLTSRVLHFFANRWSRFGPLLNPDETQPVSPGSGQLDHQLGRLLEDGNMAAMVEE